MNNSNAFWREVIEYVPRLFLVFRIDQQEEAQLIFCNHKIKEQLGYSPREYVLASEKEGVISNEIEALVDEIARRSHDVDEIRPQPCRLTDKEGRKKTFAIDFQLFQTRTGSSNMIAVELTQVQENREQIGSGESRQIENTPEENGAKQTQNEGPFFICSSDAMQSVWDTVRHVLQQSDRHLLIRGESGVGKRTLALHAIDEFERDQSKLVRIDSEDTAPVSAVRQQWKTDENRLVVFINHISALDKNQQEQLRELLRTRESHDLSTRIVATSRQNLEELIEQKEFKSELYYRIGFQTVLVPPLRHRKADIRNAALRYVRQASRVLKLNVTELKEEDLKTLEEQHWSHNFPELFRVLRRSLLDSEEGSFSLRLRQKRQFQLFPEQQIDEDEVLGFDEMNRQYLKRVLELTDGKIYGDDGAAALLDLKPTTLQSKLKRLGIK